MLPISLREMPNSLCWWPKELALSRTLRIYIIFKKRTTLWGVPKSSKTFSWKFPFHLILIPEVREFFVEWLTFRKFSYSTIWPLFENFIIVGRIESAFSFKCDFSRSPSTWLRPRRAGAVSGNLTGVLFLNLIEVVSLFPFSFFFFSAPSFQRK